MFEAKLVQAEFRTVIISQRKGTMIPPNRLFYLVPLGYAALLTKNFSFRLGQNAETKIYNSITCGLMSVS